MSDLFHEKIPLEFIQQVFDVMAQASRHTFQILTKRHERMLELANDLYWSPNVWMGVSVENQCWADRRIPALLDVPAAVRFLSVEPLLKPVDLRAYLDGIDWVIVGGESGPRARPIDPDWVRNIRDQCVAARVPFFFKQWGGRTSKSGGRILDERTWDEMPTPSFGRSCESTYHGNTASTLDHLDLGSLTKELERMLWHR
jgi:protein gp37